MRYKNRLSALLLLYLVLGTWKGYIALFEGGKTEPKQIYPTQIASLPETDQASLEKGIIVRNDRDLEALLDDYLS